MSRIDDDDDGCTCAEKKFSKISALKTEIVWLLRHTSLNELPRSLTFQEGLGEALYRIRVEVIEEDVFIDENGTKWVRQKDENIIK